MQDAEHSRHRRKPQDLGRRLSPLELAAIFAPAGTVPAIIRHDGRFILYHCSQKIAAALPTEGEA